MSNDVEPPSAGPADLAGPDSDARKKAHALLYAQGLSKVFPIDRGLLRKKRLFPALDGVSFYVRRREILGIVGESGSGKSTLGQCLVRLVEPTLGKVVFDGQDLMQMDPSALRAIRRRMQIVFQNPGESLNRQRTVQWSVGEGLDIFGLASGKNDRRRQVVDSLNLVGLSSAELEKYPHELSGGQQQRVALARALILKPDFVVLDEPTSALDLSVQAQVLNLLDDVQQDLGLTVLLISHDLRMIQYLSHRLGVMHQGRMVELGPTAHVARRRYHPYTRLLFDAMPPDPREPRKRLKLVPIAATSTDRKRALQGCAYFGECPNEQAGTCDVERPALLEHVAESQHRVACHFPNTDDDAS